MIDNVRSERVRKLVALARRSARLKQGRLLVEGPQAVTELANCAPQAIQDVYFLAADTAQPGSAAHGSPTDYSTTPYPDLLSLLAQQTCWIHPVSKAVLTAVAPSCQGIFATAQLDCFPFFSPRSDAPSLGELQTSPNRFSIVLPRTQDPGNLGTLIRIADAFGAQQVLVCQGSCDPTSPKVIRASAGSIFHLPVRQVPNFSALCTELSRANGLLVGADAHQATELADFLTCYQQGRLPALLSSATLSRLNLKAAPRPHLFLGFGNEAQGFSAAERDLLELRVKIPLPGQAESLNVAMAAAIVCYEVAKLAH